MSKSTLPGILIVVEGIDGAGKTTQAQLLDQALFGVGEEVVCAKAPTDGFWGREMGASAITDCASLEEAIEAYFQDGKQHVERTIQPELDAGRIVILDRYFHSTIANQVARGASVDELSELMNSFAPIPDATFLLDLDPTAAISRIPEPRGETSNEFEQLENLKAVRGAFNELASRDSRITRVNAHLDIGSIHETIVSVLVDTVLREKRCTEPYQHECDPFNCSFRLADECPWFAIQQSLPEKRSGDRPAALMD